MPITRLLLIALLGLPLQAHADYDPTHIKEMLAKHQLTFQLKEWQTSPEGEIKASSEIRGLTIAIGPEESILVEPYFNAAMYVPAKKRCTHFGEIALNAFDDKDLLAISETVEKATRRHALTHTALNNVRFEVLPTLVGSFVKLICKVKPDIE